MISNDKIETAKAPIGIGRTTNEEGPGRLMMSYFFGSLMIGLLCAMLTILSRIHDEVKAIREEIRNPPKSN